MRLPEAAYQMVRDRKVKVFFANRDMVAYWNERRLRGELRFYTGWYWYVEGASGHAETHEHGPFHSMSACYKDAADKLALRVPEKVEQKTTQVTGGQVVNLSRFRRMAKRADRRTKPAKGLRHRERAY